MQLSSKFLTKTAHSNCSLDLDIPNGSSIICILRLPACMSTCLEMPREGQCVLYAPASQLSKEIMSWLFKATKRYAGMDSLQCIHSMRQTLEAHSENLWQMMLQQLQYVGQGLVEKDWNLMHILKQESEWLLVNWKLFHSTMWSGSSLCRKSGACRSSCQTSSIQASIPHRLDW